MELFPLVGAVTYEELIWELTRCPRCHEVPQSIVREARKPALWLPCGHKDFTEELEINER